MDTTQLHYLRLVIEHEGFAPAALRARVTQSAITQGIAALEREVRFPLFERVGRRKKATAAGLELARAAERFTSRVDSLGADAASLNFEPDVFRVGMSPAAGLIYAPPVQRALSACEPGVALRVATGFAVSLLEDLECGLLDLVVAPRPRRLRRSIQERAVMYRSQPMIIANRENPLAHAGTLGDLAGAGWIVEGEAAGTPANLIEEAFRVRQLRQPFIAAQCFDYRMLVRMVSQSHLLGAISHPELLKVPEGKTIRRLEIVDGLPTYDVCLFVAAGSAWWRRAGGKAVLEEMLDMAVDSDSEALE